MNNYGLSDADFQQMIEVFSGFEDIEKAVLFGSRAKGNFKKNSDIDIVLFGTKLKYETVLSSSFILNEEKLMPYHFDIIDNNTIENNELKAHIQRVGKVIYKKFPDS